MGNGPKQTILTGGPQTADRKWKDAHGSGQRGDASQNHGRKRRRDRNRGSLAPRVRCGLARGGPGLGTTHAPAHTRTGKDGAGRHPGDWRSASEEAAPPPAAARTDRRGESGRGTRMPHRVICAGSESPGVTGTGWSGGPGARGGAWGQEVQGKGRSVRPGTVTRGA